MSILCNYFILVLNLCEKSLMCIIFINGNCLLTHMVVILLLFKFFHSYCLLKIFFVDTLFEDYDIDKEEESRLIDGLNDEDFDKGIR